MDLKEQEKKIQYIRERIVPKKRTKKVLQAIGATIGLALVFGAVASITFIAGNNVFGTKSETKPATIIIARDESTTAETLPEPTAGSETEETTEPTGESVDETEETEEPVIDAHMIYEMTRRSLVTILVTDEESSDWLHMQLGNQQEAVGMIIAESAENLFVLLDGTLLHSGSSIVAKINEIPVPASVHGYDDQTDLCVLRVPKNEVRGEYRIMPLGNSFDMRIASRIFLVGAPFHSAVAVDEGIVTYVRSMENVVDGYRQTICTNMRREEGGSAFLLNERGELTCIVTDRLNSMDPTLANGSGVSPLKYIIEDLCSGTDTAYLGVCGVNVRDNEAFSAGVPAGFYVQEVIFDSPAFPAGIQVGDRLVTIDGKNVINPYFLQMALDELEPGKQVEIVIERRNGKQYYEMVLSAVLGTR